MPLIVSYILPHAKQLNASPCIVSIVGCNTQNHHIQLIDLKGQKEIVAWFRHLFCVILVPLSLWSSAISFTKPTFCRLITDRCKKFYEKKVSFYIWYQICSKPNLCVMLPSNDNKDHGWNRKCWNT